MTKKLKYPIYLFFAILIAKLGYIVIESFYNYYVLVTTTSGSVEKEVLESINKTGHHISSAGITLILVPIFYFFIKKLSDKKIYIFTSIFAIIMYISAYNLLNTTIDYIIKINKDERHNAYYVNIFKYGLLNEVFYYDDFINKDKIKDNSISVEDRILLTNTFLLLYADEKLIDKLKERGKEALARRYLNDNQEYQKNYKNFEKMSNEIALLWNEFSNAKNKLSTEKNKIVKMDSKQAYNELKDELKKSYKAYVDLWKKIDEKTSKENIEDIYVKLSKYFKYKGYSKAQKEYKQEMLNHFGYYIEPNSWLYNGMLSRDSIKRRITKEILKKGGSSLENIPSGLSAGEFFNNPYIKLNLAKELKSKGVLITKDFDYSYNQFKYFYDKSTSLAFQDVIKKFYEELEKKIGKNDLKLDFTWHDFVHSNYLKDKIKSKLTSNEKIDLDIFLKVIESKDLNNFKEYIYMPQTMKEVEKIMFTREQFKTDEKAIKYGDDAIRLLYVPPFALAVSILALLLNSITVIGMIFEYSNKLSSKKIVFIKLFLFVIIISLPFIVGYNGFDNQLIQNIKNEDISNYINFLNWIGFYENLNSAIH